MTAFRGSQLICGGPTNGGILVHGSILVQNHTITELSQKQPYSSLISVPIIASNHLKHQSLLLTDNKDIITNGEWELLR